MGLLRVVLFLAILVTGGAQVCASADGIAHLLGWNTFFSWMIAMMLGWSPVVGTAISIYGAHTAWEWAWPATLALFLWPIALFAAFSVFSKE